MLCWTTQHMIRKTTRTSSMSTTSSTKNTKVSSDSESVSVIRGSRLELQGAAVDCAPHCLEMKTIKQNKTRAIHVEWSDFTFYNFIDSFEINQWSKMSCCNNVMICRRNILDLFVSLPSSATEFGSMCLGSDVMGRRGESVCVGGWVAPVNALSKLLGQSKTAHLKCCFWLLLEIPSWIGSGPGFLERVSSKLTHHGLELRSGEQVRCEFRPAGPGRLMMQRKSFGSGPWNALQTVPHNFTFSQLGQ